MKRVSFIATIKEHSALVGLMTGLAVVAALVFSLTQPFQYKAESTLLVIQNQAGLDAYTATKSAEKIGKNLTQIVSSTAFYGDVVAVDPTIKNYFSNDLAQRRKEWKRDVNLSIIPESGILELTAYGSDRATASQLVQTVSFVLVNQSAKYHGGGSDVTVKTIDDVFVGKLPSRPNLPLNIALAAILGFVFSSIYALLHQTYRISKGEVENDELELTKNSGLNLTRNKFELV